MSSKGDIKKDVRDLLNLLHRVTTKNVCERINLHYEGEHFNLTIVLIGRPRILNGGQFSHEPYVNFIERAIEDGTNTFYLLATGQVNKWIAGLVATELEMKQIARIADTFIDEVESEGGLVNKVCIRLETPCARSEKKIKEAMKMRPEKNSYLTDRSTP